MKPSHFFAFALVAAIAATIGSDIFARVSIGGQSVGSAGGEHLRYALSDWIGTLFLFAPFLAVGWTSAALRKRGQTRFAFVVLAVGLLPLIYFYIEGYRGAQQALADEQWTAAALSIGLLPFVVGIPVMLLVGFASWVAIRLESRPSE